MSDPDVKLSKHAKGMIGEVRMQYLHLLSHFDALNIFLNNCQLSGEVFVLPRPTQNDVGKAPVSYTAEHIKGVEAAERAMLHFTEHKLKHEQAGVMANRLLGVLHVQTLDDEELVGRVANVNHEKDKLVELIRSSSEVKAEQFELTKAAIPYAIRKSIGRHLSVFRKGELQSVSFSFTSRTSMSKAQPRKYWLEKLERSRKYVSLKDRDRKEWHDQVNIEERILSQLPEDEMLREVRPLRRAPVANLLFRDKRKKSPLAHSPLLIINDKDVKINPMQLYKEYSTEKQTREPVIPRWHLYRVSDLL